MKRIIMFLGLIISLYSCKVLRTPQVYSNETVCLWVKPVNIDTSTLSEGKTYLIEGYKPNGTPVLVFVKEDILRKVMRLEWDPIQDKRAGDNIGGRVFTCNYLGRKSLLSEKEITKGKKYDSQQQETLLRDKNVEKYELRSFLPIKVSGKIQKDKATNQYKIVLTEGDANSVLKQNNSKGWPIGKEKDNEDN